MVHIVSVEGAVRRDSRIQRCEHAWKNTRADSHSHERWRTSRTLLADSTVRSWFGMARRWAASRILARGPDGI